MIPTSLGPLAGRGRGRPAMALAAGVLGSLALPGVVLAHGGEVPSEPPSPANLLLGWSFDPTIWLPVIGLVVLWRAAVRRVDRAHPGNPVPRYRTWAFLAGLAAILVALDSGIERYDTTLFSVHMVQHLLLTLVGPPLLLLAAPVTLVLRAVAPDTRRRRVLPVLHSRALGVLAHPIVAWLVFAGVMWGSHFSPLFDAALEDELAHRVEHGLFIGSALLFWWPVVAADPAPRRMGYAARVPYLFLQMPQNTFLALAIYSASAPLYPHYTSVVRDWGPSPLVDQQIAGGIMWLGGDLLFLAALLVLVGVWLRDEERRTVRDDRRVDAERAAIREREARLAARRAADAGTDQGAVTSGAVTSGAVPSAAARTGAQAPRGSGASR